MLEAKSVGENEIAKQAAKLAKIGIAIFTDFKLKVIEVIVPIKIVEKTKMIIKLYALGRRLSGEVAIAKSRILKNGLARAIKLPRLFAGKKNENTKILQIKLKLKANWFRFL